MLEVLMICISVLFMFCMLIIPFIIPVVIIVVVLIVYKKNKEEYENSSYYKITKIPYGSIKNNLGNYGEYLTYCKLKNFEKSGAKFLFNLYIPKDNGKTTEIDVLMICKTGVFVFESKNYSGWIFGSETQKYWYQTLSSGYKGIHKESFYNPVLQNYTHIKFLKKLIGEDILIRSVIVFSDRCTLKNIIVKSKDVFVIKRCNLTNVITQLSQTTENNVFDENRINEIYDKLYQYTQVEKSVKAQHIINIKK